MRLEPKPRWSVSLEPGEHGGRLSHARLLPDAVAGCWFALERETGERRWSDPRLKADEIFGIAGDVVIGTRVQGTGIHMESLGVWGVSLGTGRLLWQWPQAGPLEALSARVMRMLGVREPPPDGPLLVQGNRLYTRGRKVLDCSTGLLLQNAGPAPEEAPADPDQELSTEFFFLRTIELPGSGLRLLRQFDTHNPLEHLKHERCSHPEPVPYNLGAVDSRGQVVWERRYDQDRRPVTNFFGSRFLHGRLVLLECAPGPELVVLDPATGSVEQAVSLSATAACIQAVDARGILLGLGGTVSAALKGLAYVAVARE